MNVDYVTRLQRGYRSRLAVAAPACTALGAQPPGGGTPWA